MRRGAAGAQGSNPAWTLQLASVTLVALLILALLGPWMTLNNTGAQNVARQAGYAAILVSSLISLRPWRHPERLLVVPWPMLAALAWCWLSAVWMIDPAVGTRRLVLTTIIAWSLFALVRQLGAERTVKLLQAVFAVALAVNFIFVIFFPEIGKHPSQGDIIVDKWRGLMGHKNFAGVPCAAAVLLFVFDSKRVHWAVRAAVCAGAVAFLVGSGSKTSMGIGAFAVAVGLGFAFLATRLKQRQLAPPALAWALLIGPALIFVSMALNNAPFLDMVSDPAAFTGRTQIWTALIKAYVDHPWLGVGYGSFWDLGPSGPIFHYGSGWITEMSEGHNAYLDLLVQIGCIGTLIVLYAVLAWPTQRLLYGGEHPARTLAAAIIVFCMGHAFTESQMFDRDSLVQVLLMIAIALLWSVTAAPVQGGFAAVPERREPGRPRAPLRL